MRNKSFGKARWRLTFYMGRFSVAAVCHDSNISKYAILLLYIFHKEPVCYTILFMKRA